MQPGGVAGTPGSLTQLHGPGSTEDTLHWLCLPMECCPLHRISGGTLLAHSVHRWVTAQAYSCHCFIIGFIWTLNIHLSINKIIGLARIIKLHLPLVTVWEVLHFSPYTSLKKITFFSQGSVRFQVTILSTAWTRHRLGLEPWFWLQGQNVSTLLHSIVSSPRLCHFHLRAAEEGTNSTCCYFLSRWLKQSFYKAYQPNPAKMKSKNVTQVRTEACVYQEFTSRVLIHSHLL